MFNARKTLLFMLCLFLITGCSANYDVEIYNNKVKEKFDFLETDKNTLDKVNETQSIEGEHLTNQYLIETESKKDSSAFINESSPFYNKKKLTNGGIGIKYNYDFNLDNYNNSFAVNSAFKHFNLLNEDDLYIISTSKGVEMFNSYNDLDILTVHLKTNHKVKDNNADRVDGYNYYWDVDKTNYKDKSIYIELYKDKYVFNYENRVIKILIGSLSIAFLAVIVIIFMKKKASNRNKI